jgi:hypothetical protein
MPTKHLGAVYLVDTACFSISVQKKFRETLPSNKKKFKTLDFKVSGLLPGTRSYECKVVGTGATVRLSSKSLSHVHSSGSRTESPEQSQNTSDDSSGADGVEESESSAEDAAEADVVDATPAGLSLVGAGALCPILTTQLQAAAPMGQQQLGIVTLLPSADGTFHSAFRSPTART